MPGPIISRTDAHTAGLSRFYTGRPCVRGHDDERYVSSGNCVACLSWKVVRKPAAMRKSTTLCANQWWPPTPYTLPDGVPPTPQNIAALHSVIISLMPELHVRAFTLQPTAKANKTPLEAFRRQGWTDEALVREGYATRGAP